MRFSFRLTTFLLISIPAILCSQILTNPSFLLEFVGNQHFSDDLLLKLVKSRFENRINRQLLKEDCRRIREYYEERGFITAHCSYQIKEGTNSDARRILIQIYEGELYRFGTVSSIGNFRTTDTLLTRLIRFSEGDPFSRKAIVTTQSRLMQTGLFSNVHIKREGIDESANRINVTIEVTEKERYYADFGTGYDSEDSWQNFVVWGNRYLDGYGKRVSITGLYAVDYQDELYFKKGEVTLDYTDHVFIRPGLQNTAQISYVKDKPKGVNFGFEKMHMSFGVAWEVSELSALYSQILFDRINLFSVNLEENSRSFRSKIGDDRSSGIRVGFDRDNRDDFVDPTRGNNFDISLLYNPGLLGRIQQYLQLSTRFSFYHLALQRLVLANQSSIGAQIRERSDAPLPQYLRLYLGGAASLRGYSQSSVGPVFPDGTARGGHFLFLNNLELRYYLSYSINFVLLFDTGNLWLESGMIKLATLKNSAGIGIRYRSRFGFFRLDFAVPVQPASSGRFHVGFGQAF